MRMRSEGGEEYVLLTSNEAGHHKQGHGPLLPPPVSHLQEHGLVVDMERQNFHHQFQLATLIDYSSAKLTVEIIHLNYIALRTAYNCKSFNMQD